MADFCKRHDLMLISDEIHHDLVFGGHKHLPMPVAVPEVSDRLIMLTAPSKTFNIAGLHTGQVIIPDEALRERFRRRMLAIYLQGNTAAARQPPSPPIRPRGRPMWTSWCPISRATRRCLTRL